MLGRVQELLGMDKELKEARKQFDVAEGEKGLEKAGKGRGRGRKKKGAEVDGDGEEEE